MNSHLETMGATRPEEYFWLHKRFKTVRRHATGLLKAGTEVLGWSGVCVGGIYRNRSQCAHDTYCSRHRTDSSTPGGRARTGIRSGQTSRP